MLPLQVRASLKWTAITLLAIVGLIHLLEAPEYFQKAAYLGILFVANALGAAVAIWGITQQMVWGWVLGILVAAGALIAYFIGRAFGLPGLANTPWFESIDVISLIVEAAFVGIAAKVVLGQRPAADFRRTHHLPPAA